MEYFAGLDISMKETHICVVDRDGKVVYEARAATSPAAIAAELAKAPAAQRIVFETGRMATTLYHGLQALGLATRSLGHSHSRRGQPPLPVLATGRLATATAACVETPAQCRASQRSAKLAGCRTTRR